MNVKRGILLLATGAAYYGRMAYSLTISIKATDKDFPVALVCDQSAISHLSTRQREIFDYLIPAPGGGFGMKFQLDLLTPFEETLFLDADMAWLPGHTPDQLIDSLPPCPFTAITEGYCDMATLDTSQANTKYYFWAKPEEIRQVYAIEAGRLYQWRSEVMYFNRQAAPLFELMREIYANPGLSTLALFADHIPDELAINIGCAKLGIEPHAYRWMPAYWARMYAEQVPPLEQLYGNYYLLSCGSNVVTAQTKSVYNRVVKAACSKFGVQHLFPVISKKEMMPTRQRM